MSASLADYQETEWEYTPLTLARSSASQAFIESELRTWRMQDWWLGGQPVDINEDVEYRRYQYDRLYFYFTRKPGAGEGETEIAPVEFRTYVYWVGTVPEGMKDHFREEDNPRLRTLFDTGVYEGWMSGFEFQEHASNVEDNRVAEDEVNNLGIPQWEVLVYDEDGAQVGHAGGKFDPFALVEHVPKQEVWDVTKNPARSSYEIRPQAGARQRILGKQKLVYLNGKYIGATVPTRGTVWLKMEYDTISGTYGDPNPGIDKQMHSRQTILDAGASPSSIREGGKVYKVREEGDKIFLVANKPDDFDPTPQEAVDPKSAAEMRLADATDFLVQHDNGQLLGKYTAPETRSISRGTDWNTQPRGGR